MDRLDFDALIINERHKIWEDKLKLTKQSQSSNNFHQPEDVVKDDRKVEEFVNDGATNLENISPNQNFGQTRPTQHYIGALSEQSPFSYVRSESNSPANDAGKHSESRCRTAAFRKANTEPRMATMVRFGEYSPLNPNLLSPGKSLLGLGEYEEKRRQLMNRKKQEYREYLAQARQFGSKNSTPAKPSDITKQTVLFPVTERNNAMSDYIHDGSKPLSTLSNASTNTTPTKPAEFVKLSNILSDSRTNPSTNSYLPNINRVVTNASTNTTPERVSRDVQTEQEWDLGTVSVRLSDINHTVASPVENVWTDMLPSNKTRNRGMVGNETSPDVSSQTFQKPRPENGNRHANVHEPVKFLSPRERKLADLQESGARSPGLDFSESLPQDGISPAAVKTQREAYKEELRKQIEEKQRLDAVVREKARLEEEVIARRVSQQQERMRQEFLREEAERKERQAQRCSQMEEFRRRQEEMKKAERERYLRTKSNTIAASQDREGGCEDAERKDEVELLDGSPPAVPATARIPQNQYRRQAEGASRKLRSTPSEEGHLDPVGNRNEKVDLDDSLPIPVFRARSPVVPALRTTVELNHDRASANSKEMQMLEAKWQVPAVQKTSFVPTAEFLGDGSQGCPKTILTQLGAFRRQLQMEQMRMEEIVQRRNQPNLTT